MKELSGLLFGLSGLSAAVLLSYAGHLWLPKVPFLWVFQVSGVAIFWAIALLLIILFAIWSVAAAASAHHQQGLEFGVAQMGQSLMLAIGAFIAVLVINGVALWLV